MGVIGPDSGPLFADPFDPKFVVSDPIFSLNPDSSAFRRIRLVPAVGDLAADVFGLGFGLGSIDEVLDLRLE